MYESRKLQSLPDIYKLCKTKDQFSRLVFFVRRPMTGEEAIPLLRKGKLMRRKVWSSKLHVFMRQMGDTYYLFAQGADIIDMMDDKIQLSDFFYDDWEIYVDIVDNSKPSGV